jgi:hypothetical protein
VRLLAFLTVVSACTASVIPLIDTNGVPVTLTPGHAIPLEVITRKNATVPDPLPVRGGPVAFAQLETALGHAVSSAAAPWVEKHSAQSWQLDVELISADARARGREVTVVLDVRATLRARTGNGYIAQTQTHCQRSALVEARAASPVVFACMSHIGRVLGGWLGGIEP